MKTEDYRISKKRCNFLLSEQGRKIVEDKVREWGVNRTSVIELALREIDKKDNVN